MLSHVRRAPLLLGAILCLLVPSIYGQALSSGARRIKSFVDDRERVALRGQRHPAARIEDDRGAASPGTRLERMVLTLQPEESRQRELEALLEAQHDPGSPDFQRWLTPQEFGARFGVSEWDLLQVVSWLKSAGFDVEEIPESRLAIVFSGTVGQTEAAFHTPIHIYAVGGQEHHANAADPEIPAALAGVVGGVVSLHDFHAMPLHAGARALADVSPEYSSGSTHYVSPADFTTIYNLSPLYSAALDGKGQSVAIVGRSNIKSSDLQSFRSMFGLPAGAPQVIVNGTDPGIPSTDEQFEAQLDVEWAGAVALNGQVQFVTSASTTATDGVVLSAQYIVNHNVAPIVSLSFGSCEQAMGTGGNQFWNSLWQQAAAQGMSVLVASGDSGAAGCDGASNSTAAYGRGVNGLCSSPYVTCVGGTQFNDTANASLYWATSNKTYGSALSYIPEVAWNTSASTSGGSGLWATGGGASTIYTKPAWQTGTGVPADNHRYVPDVSLNGSVHDGYLVVVNGQTYAAGGTSGSTPAFAGLMALVLQKQGAKVGNPNPVLYALRALQARGGTAVFHDVTSGDNTVPGVTGYTAGSGYDAATGLGSVDATQFVNHWSDGNVGVPAFQLTAPTTASVTQGATSSVTVTVAASGGFSGEVTLSAGTLPAGLSAQFSPAKIPAPGSGTSVLTLSATTLAAKGTSNLTITASGGSLTRTAPLAVTIASACSYTLGKTAQAAGAAGAGYTVSVTAATNCAWTAASASSWITVASGASGTGNGTVAYTVATNTFPAHWDPKLRIPRGQVVAAASIVSPKY